MCHFRYVVLGEGDQWFVIDRNGCIAWTPQGPQAIYKTRAEAERFCDELGVCYYVVVQ